MLIRVSGRMVGAALDHFMSEMFAPDGSLLASKFELDFTYLTFIEPAGVASLANAIEYANRRGCPVVIMIGEVISAPIRYLDDSGFFKLYAGKSLNPAATLRGTTAPLQKISHAESHHWLEAKFGYWLAQRLGVPAGALGSIRACMMEVFNNIENHSGFTIGCTHMQHFPTKNEIVIAVSDFGVGIPTAIRRKFPEFTDDEKAIHHASTLGVTSGSTPRNQGIGLDFLISLVVAKNQGTVHIHSGHGILACKTVAAKEVRKPWRASAFYPGTMIEIRLKTTTFVPDDLDREVLEW